MNDERGFPFLPARIVEVVEMLHATYAGDLGKLSVKILPRLEISIIPNTSKIFAHVYHDILNHLEPPDEEKITVTYQTDSEGIRTPRHMIWMQYQDLGLRIWLYGVNMMELAYES